MRDYHIHTAYSADIKPGEGAGVREICEKAIESGFEEIAFTDHYDVVYDTHTFLDHDNVRKDVFAAKDEFKGRLSVIYGIEFGQPAHFPDESLELLKKYNYEYVIGSVHAVRGIYDFKSTDLAHSSDEYLHKLWRQYLDEMAELVEWGHFDTLAHITYGLRYYKWSGKEYILDLEKRKYEYFEPILRAIIERGIALEINTSGIRQGIGSTIPDLDLVKFYKELGGKYIVVGSDSHFLKDVGANIADGVEVARAAGFDRLTAFGGNGKYTYRI